MYERMGKAHEQLSGLTVVETDDLLGGGVGDKFMDAVNQLRARVNVGKWQELTVSATEYGGRTLRQDRATPSRSP